ncbi:MAG: cbb3-type cytochrome oxidase assembly protein CcoS [Halobacteriovoraceae bacterium]|nr:cbb3-type cytochrome oxidase assembly protein CcoS [Halobacteriovoraceae bacterium]
MNIVYFLIPIALLLGALFVGAFIWATKTGQYEDLDTPSHRILLDDDNINDNLKKDEE